MNKMTIVLLMLLIALVSYGTKVYAENRPDSAGTENIAIDTINVPRLEAVVVDSAFQAMKEEVDSIKYDISSLKSILFICAGAILILLLLIILAFFKLADKASNKKLSMKYEKLYSKIEKATDEMRWNSVKPRREESYKPHDSRKSDEQPKKAEENPKPKSEDTKPEKTPEKPQPAEVRNVKKEIYVGTNQDDIFVGFTDQKLDKSVFVIEYDPEDKSHMGDLSVIGNINTLRVINKESRDKSIRIVKSDCAWAEAKDYILDHVGTVVKNNDVWQILNPVDIILKK